MSTFNRIFTVSTFGESHCPGVGCIVNGVPPRMSLCEADIQKQLSRRRPGQSKITTPRDEKDRVRILSGTECGVTLGTPIALLVMNEDQRPGDYGHHADIPRPSHADWTYQEKYGVRASSGGGRASARETIGRVAAGAIAEKWLFEKYGVRIIAYVSAIADVSLPTTMKGAALGEKELSFDPFTLTREQVDATPVRCPDAETSRRMQTVIEKARDTNDSVGGVVTCYVMGMPSGWGEPVFDKLQATIAHAMMSIPATKGFELGSGFEGTKLPGSQHNDMFTINSKTASTRLGTVTNYSGGIQGGISNGEYLYFRVAFKPAATISRTQHTVDFNGQPAVLETKGRHDPSVVPRAVPIVESMIALVLADAALLQEARIASASIYPLMGKLSPHAPALVQQPHHPTSTTSTSTSTSTSSSTNEPTTIPTYPYNATSTNTSRARSPSSPATTAIGKGEAATIQSYPYNVNTSTSSVRSSSSPATTAVGTGAAATIQSYPYNANTTNTSSARSPSSPATTAVGKGAAATIQSYPYNVDANVPTRPSSPPPPSPSRLRAPPPTVADFSSPEPPPGAYSHPAVAAAAGMVRSSRL